MKDNDESNNSITSGNQDKPKKKRIRKKVDELDTDEETDEQTPDQIKKRTDAPVRTRSKNVRK